MTADGRRPDAEEVRLRLQAEMTLLLWIKSAVGLMAFGFLVARLGLFLRDLAEAGQPLLRPDSGLLVRGPALGTALLGGSAVVLVAAVALHLRLVGRLESGRLDFAARWSVGLLLCLLLVALGMALAAYLALVAW